MNDFSFPNIFRAAFNIFAKHFTDIFLVTVLSATAILVMSLFLNSVFLGHMNLVMDAALSGNVFKPAADTNPFIMFSLYIGTVLIFAALVMFFIFSLLLPLCKGQAMKLKNYVPSLPAIVMFIVSMLALFTVFGGIVVALPLLAKFVSDGGGYTATGLIVSIISFAVITFLAVFALKYIFYFLPILEGAGIKEALKKSKALTNNCLMKIFVLFAVLFVINFFAKYFIFLLLITIPFSVLTVIYAYLDLCGYEIGRNGIIKT